MLIQFLFGDVKFLTLFLEQIQRLLRDAYLKNPGDLQKWQGVCQLAIDAGGQVLEQIRITFNIFILKRLYGRSNLGIHDLGNV